MHSRVKFLIQKTKNNNNFLNIVFKIKLFIYYYFFLPPSGISKSAEIRGEISCLITIEGNLQIRM